MRNIIGIDLGTSTTLVACLNEAGHTDIVRNDEGDNVTHSAVWFESPGNIVVGKEAKKMHGLAGEGRVFVEYKRDMHDNKVSHVVDGKEYRPRDLSAIVLAKIMGQLKSAGRAPDAVVITTPANFMDEARTNTLEAARLAGFDLQGDCLVNEPTAAALYYATRAGVALDGYSLVYDFGGGTFDATILEVRGDDYRVKTSEGASHIGGKDFDDKLMGIIAAKFTESTGARFDAQALGVTKWDIEQNYKHTLSVRDKVAVVIRSQEHGVVRFEITRREFEEAISDIVAQAHEYVSKALNRANLRPSDIRHVFLAGGTTRVPFVAAKVEQFFGKKPFTDNPDEAVARGAAIYAGIRNKHLLREGQRTTLADKKVMDVTPYHYGTISADPETNELVNSIIILKDKPLPCTESRQFRRTPQNSRTLKVRITQTGRTPTEIAQRNHDGNMLLVYETKAAHCKVVFEGDWNLPAITTDSVITAIYSYDSNGMVRCKFVDQASGDVFERDVGSAPGTSASGVDDILL